MASSARPIPPTGRGPLNTLRANAILALILGAAAPAVAQPAALLGPLSARALGMGDAFVVTDSDPETLFVNPSFEGNLRGIAIGINRYDEPDGALGFSAAAGVAWWRGAVGLGVRSAEGSAAATLGYAMDIVGVPLGVAVSLIEARNDGARSDGVAWDIGTNRDIGPLSIGFAVRHLGSDLALDDSDTAIDLAERYALNIASESAIVGPLDVTLAAAASFDADGDWIGGAGIEAAYWPVQGRTFAVRTGVHRGSDHTARITLGAGVQGDDIVLDWGWMDGVHRLGLGWR